MTKEEVERIGNYIMNNAAEALLTMINLKQKMQKRLLIS